MSNYQRQMASALKSMLAMEQILRDEGWTQFQDSWIAPEGTKDLPEAALAVLWGGTRRSAQVETSHELADTRSAATYSQDVKQRQYSGVRNMKNPVMINRPYISSFNFAAARVSQTHVEQMHKLTRNFVASLNLGAPVNHVNKEKLAETKDLYSQWVKDWKVIYGELSQLIFLAKLNRRTVRFPVINSTVRDLIDRHNKNSNRTPQQILQDLSSPVNMDRLKETAQVLLNARFNAKLAAGELYRREKERGAKALEYLQG